jgi:histone acetyltransferase
LSFQSFSLLYKIQKVYNQIYRYHIRTHIMYQQFYPPASKPIQSLTFIEKLLKIGRNIPCTADGPNSERCSCLGWKPKPHNTGRADLCACGHRVVVHGESNNLSPEESNRRLEIAMKIDRVLEAKGKLLDFEYQDEEIRGLRMYVHVASLIY